MRTLKFDHAEVYFSFSREPEVIGSFVEAANYVARNSTRELVLVFVDEAGKEVRLGIHNAQYSNVPTYLTGQDTGRDDGLVELPTEAPPKYLWT